MAKLTEKEKTIVKVGTLSRDGRIKINSQHLKINGWNEGDTFAMVNSLDGSKLTIKKLDEESLKKLLGD